MRGDLLEIFAREKAQQPPEWEAYKFECLPHGEPTLYYEITGAIRLIGPRGGRKWDKVSLRKVTLTAEQALRLAEEWSRKMGKCWQCMGTGQLLKSWNAKTGSIYRPCPHCNGTGATILESMPKGE